MNEDKATPQGKILLEPGTFWSRVREQTEYALKCGALLSLPSECEFVEQNGVHFLVRILSNLVRKDKAKQKQDKQKTSGGEFNPFLPYEEDLFVADISDTHVCILNKYNVVDYHLLIITRAFEEQESLLTLEDFAAMWACLAEFDGLVFYNSGKIAGASQRHKHLQMVPLPLTSEEPLPIAPLLTNTLFHRSIGSIIGLPFLHAFINLDTHKQKSAFDAATATLKSYRQLLQGLDLEDNGKLTAAYNLLVTREWMLIIPRSQSDFESIPVNSLGFAGAMLVRNQQQMQILKEVGPMTLLSKVALKNRE
ncbi:MAG: phosphorylase [Nostocaceae cyanobacterium]|nr:phosphorylase [Nostocaceae cyanobacterium]